MRRSLDGRDKHSTSARVSGRQMCPGKSPAPGQEQGARNPSSFLMNAVSRTITTVITTHPFVPNFGGEVDFSPIKLGPVTTFWAHSAYRTGVSTVSILGVPRDQYQAWTTSPGSP